MLSLTRKRDESVKVGSDLLEVVHITNSAVHMKIEAENGSVRVIRVVIGNCFALGRGEVIVFSANKNLVRMGFDFPQDISIMRLELIEKSASNYPAAGTNILILPQNNLPIINVKHKLQTLKLLSKFSPKKLSSTLDDIARDLMKIA
jgi:sRNA-binding carbon storage regulator CsrA